MGKSGQPTKYREDFHNDDFIQLSKQGKNISEIALEWDVDRDCIYEWAKKHPRFSGTVKKGKAFCEAWYTKIGRLAMLGEATINGRKIKVDVGLYVWLTKNLFKWTDKMQLEEQLERERPLKNLSDEELDAL